jgi:integrase
MKDIDSEGSKIIFCNRKDKQMSDVSLNKALKSVYPDVTVHGFRSTFRVWGAETTSYPSQVLEFAIAHVDPDKVQEAYQRSRLIERRRELMKDWGNYCL